MGIDIVGIGYPCLDLIVQIPNLPQSGETVPAQQYIYQGGGTVSTAMAAASVLGASAGIIGLVGDDFAGQLCLRDLRFNSVDTSRIVMDKNSETAFNICLSESTLHQRSFLSYESAFRQLKPRELDCDYLARAKWLHLARMDDFSVAAAKIARENGVKVMLDADMYDARTLEFCEYIDVIIASEEYYSGRFTGGSYEENCKKICEEGPSTAVITLGDRGCVAVGRGKFFAVPAFTGIDVVDTTGAGDVFHGAFLYGLLQGWELARIAEFACAASAIKCTRLGGRTGIPSRGVVEKFLDTGDIDAEYMRQRESAYHGMKFGGNQME